MRTFLKIFITVVVLAGGFVGYILLQPPSALKSQVTTRPVAQPLKKSESGMLIGEGENAWIRQFDAEGRLASRFRAGKWEPQKSGLVRVVKPEAELFLKAPKGKPRPLVIITGDEGEVVVQSLPDAAQADTTLDSKAGAPAGGGGGMGQMQAPSSGRLNGVVIRVFEAEDDPSPAVTLKTNNIVFDNETFRISTESYTTPDGKTVPPDEVAVSIEGRYFDFYGRGLTVRWNDLAERLDLLRIAHGERLVIKNVEALSGNGSPFGGSPLGAPRKRANEPARAAARALPLWPLLASADPAAAIAVAAANPVTAPATSTAPASRPARRKSKDAAHTDEEQPPYRATFNDGVRVLQGEQQLALAVLMHVDFLLGDKKDPAATRPATSATAPAATQPVTTQSTATEVAATTQPVSTQPATTQAAGTTQPAAEPLTVYWTGELTVTPAPVDAEDPLPQGEARVELVGSPLLLTRELVDINSARLVYRTDGRLSIESSEQIPQVRLTQRANQSGGVDTTVITEKLEYATNEKVATLRGRSRVSAPIGSGEAGKPDMLDAAWRDSATFHLAGETEGAMWVERADFAGDVDMNAPQGKVRAQRLELTFDAPATPPADLLLPPPAANGAVEKAPDTQPAPDAPLPHSDRPDTLPATQPARSQPNLRRVVATEGVYCELVDAKEGRRTLACQRLALDTAVSPEGNLYPRLVDASGAVHAATADQELNAGRVVLNLRPATKVETAASDAPVTSQAADGEPAGDEVAENPAASPGGGDTAGTTTADAGVATTVDTGPATKPADAVAVAKPAKADGPAVELESMVATDAVRIASKEGGTATGKRLEVTVADDGEPRIELSGDPASVEDGKNGTLTGPRIVVDPRSGVAHVPGAGTLRAVQRDQGDAPDSPGRPIEVTWSDHADVKANDNRIDIAGAVSLWITDADGSVRTATAGRVSVELAEKPAPEKPAEDKPADAKGDEKKGDSASIQLAGSMEMDLFKNKEVARVHMHDDAVINSKLAAEDGTLLRQFHLKAGTITYDVRARHLRVPGPGQMLVESHEPRAKDGEAGKGDDAGGAKPADALAAGSGVTAFQWANSIEYEESAGRATMDGSVIVSHQADDKAQPPVRLDADKVIASFVPRAEGAQAAASPPKTGDGPQLDLKSIVADGQVLINREGTELSAQRVEFDPATHWVIARGTERNPAVFSHPSGVGTMRATELRLNTQTWTVQITDVNTRVGGLSR
jgi:hypothetical protein